MLNTNIHNLFQLITVINHSGGVGRIIKHKSFCLIGDSCFKLLCGNLEILLLTCTNDNGLTVSHFYHFIIADPVRSRKNYLITGVGDGRKRNK